MGVTSLRREAQVDRCVWPISVGNQSFPWHLRSPVPIHHQLRHHRLVQCHDLEAKGPCWLGHTQSLRDLSEPDMELGQKQCQNSSRLSRQLYKKYLSLPQKGYLFDIDPQPCWAVNSGSWQMFLPGPWPADALYSVADRYYSRAPKELGQELSRKRLWLRFLCFFWCFLVCFWWVLLGLVVGVGRFCFD